MTVAPVSAPVPADVRAAGPEAADRYRSALAFEQLLVGQLTRSMVAGTALAEGPHAGAIDEAMTAGLTAAGGLGLAETLYRSMLEGTPEP